MPNQSHVYVIEIAIHMLRSSSISVEATTHRNTSKLIKSKRNNGFHTYSKFKRNVGAHLYDEKINLLHCNECLRAIYFWHEVLLFPLIVALLWPELCSNCFPIWLHFGIVGLRVHAVLISQCCVGDEVAGLLAFTDLPPAPAHHWPAPCPQPF